MPVLLRANESLQPGIGTVQVVVVVGVEDVGIGMGVVADVGAGVGAGVGASVGAAVGPGRGSGIGAGIGPSVAAGMGTGCMVGKVMWITVNIKSLPASARASEMAVVQASSSSHRR